MAPPSACTSIRANVSASPSCARPNPVSVNSMADPALPGSTCPTHIYCDEDGPARSPTLVSLCRDQQFRANRSAFRTRAEPSLRWPLQNQSACRSARLLWKHSAKYRRPASAERHVVSIAAAEHSVRVSVRERPAHRSRTSLRPVPDRWTFMAYSASSFLNCFEKKSCSQR